MLENMCIKNAHTYFTNLCNYLLIYKNISHDREFMDLRFLHNGFISLYIFKEDRFNSTLLYLIKKFKKGQTVY